MTPERRPRSGDTVPCGQTNQHDAHLYVAEGMQTPIACPGVDHTPDLPCERTDAHDPHPNAVHIGPGDDLADTHVNGHCPGRSVAWEGIPNDPAPTTIVRYCGATGNHEAHTMTPVFSPSTTFACDGQDPRMADPAYRAMVGNNDPDIWAGLPGGPPLTLRADRWLSEHMRDTPSKDEVAALVKDNDRRLGALAAQGFPVNHASILDVRITLLCDVLFGSAADPRRTAFEFALARQYADQIGKVEAAARKAQLAAAGQPPSALLIPGNPFPNGPTNGRRRR